VKLTKWRKRNRRTSTYASKTDEGLVYIIQREGKKWNSPWTLTTEILPVNPWKGISYGRGSYWSFFMDYHGIYPTIEKAKKMANRLENKKVNASLRTY